MGKDLYLLDCRTTLKARHPSGGNDFGDELSHVWVRFTCEHVLLLGHYEGFVVHKERQEVSRLFRPAAAVVLTSKNGLVVSALCSA